MVDMEEYLNRFTPAIPLAKTAWAVNRAPQSEQMDSARDLAPISSVAHLHALNLILVFHHNFTCIQVETIGG